MRKSSVQPVNSAISGQVELVQRRQSLAGAEPGKTGSARSLIVSEETARGWLLRQANPAETDAALCRSLISSLNVTALLRSESRFPPGGKPYQVCVGCDLAIDDDTVVPEAIAKVEQAMVEATAEQCEGWLVMLQAATAHRADSEATSAVAYTLYASELRRYPADVAKAVCERFARGMVGNGGTNWFPTLADVVKECERFAAPRRAILNSLHRWGGAKALPYPSARGRPEPSEADKELVRRMAAKALRDLADASAAKQAAHAPMPAVHGKTDEGGLTPQMRELIKRREQSA